MIDFLLARRSSRPAMLGDPGPTPEDLNKILTVAARVPDHKKLVPWRFIVFEGEARALFGAQLAEICAQEEAEPLSPVRLETERARLMRAPVVIAVVSRINRERGVPELEQTLSAGAACLNLCHAANALGYGTSWITEWYSFSPGVRGLMKLTDDEQIAGFIYVGTASEKQQDRDRPTLTDIVSRWEA
ncbi:MAG: nitroreductase family protein [Hyphomicrobiaceae bacterium]